MRAFGQPVVLVKDPEVGFGVRVVVGVDDRDRLRFGAFQREFVCLVQLLR